MIDHSATVSATSEGIVGAMTVPQLLAKAWHDRQTAILRLSDGRNWRLIHIHDGSPTAIELSTVADAFALMLEESELISSDERADVEDFARKKRCPQATAVLALRLIDAIEPR